ncbi:FAH family protein [Streptacidiphilus pinicola]|uniref:FAH family protein n=1 Tax=Streptacidiphilus pinicola TaxID=2219663 RepID=A0A2X0J3E6_9ACTN|nr:fumarylacetoacetate hydrolase family protein [Streptacidiphilus pinicola]RAG81908.1 FAH family protein [Streptacidiphilus pinicola]
MTIVYECEYEGERWLGLGLPNDQDPLLLHPLGEATPAGVSPAGATLVGGLPAAGGDVAAAVARLTEGRTPVEVSPARRHRVRMLPALRPAHAGDALVSGFMMTHNVKVDAEVPDQPTWFVKGSGDSLRVPGEPLAVPADAVAVCEEAEVVLVYVGDETGVPRYVGYTFGNDLTDIGRFKQHPGHLSYAKLCDAGLAPWLHLAEPPRSVTGEVVVERDGVPAWKGTFATGTDALHYDVPTMMARLFAHHALLRPGLVHYVFLGADRSSFHAGFRTQDGDVITIGFASHGVTLSHPLRFHPHHGG